MCDGKQHAPYRYNHKLMKLAEAVLREVVDFKVEEDRFQVHFQLLYQSQEPCTKTHLGSNHGLYAGAHVPLY